MIDLRDALQKGFKIITYDENYGVYETMLYEDSKVLVQHYDSYLDAEPEDTEEYDTIDKALKFIDNYSPSFIITDDLSNTITEPNLIKCATQDKTLVRYVGKDVTKLSGPSFITKNGTCINMDQIHDDLGYMIQDADVSLSRLIIGEICTYGSDYWNVSLTDHVINKLHWIKMNDGLTDWDNRCYAVIRNNQITQQQFNQLIKWIDFVSTTKDTIEIIAKDSPPRTYSLDNPEDIQMKLVKYRNSGQLSEKLDIDFDNFNGKIIDGNFGLGSLVTVEINGKQYTRRVYDDPKTDLYIVIQGVRIYFQDFWNWNRSDEENLTEDFHNDLAHEVEQEVTAGRSVKLYQDDGGFVLFTPPLDSDFGVTQNDVVRVTFFNENNEPYDYDVYDSFIDATAGYKETEWETLQEDFPDAEHRIGHYKKHCSDDSSFEFPSTLYKDDMAYEAAANKLAKERVFSSDLDSLNTIVGFIQKDGAYVKYNKQTRALVKYKPDTRFGQNVKIITYYKANPNKYKLLREREYKRDIK